MTKRHRFSNEHTVIQTDEIGRIVQFQLPMTAVYYDTHHITNRQSMKHDNQSSELGDKDYARQDEDDRMLWDADDKMDFISQMKRERIPQQ
jgi:hypothetical protein